MRKLVLEILEIKCDLAEVRVLEFNNDLNLDCWETFGF
jgi:hypothetical protein